MNSWANRVCASVCWLFCFCRRVGWLEHSAAALVWSARVWLLLKAHTCELQISQEGLVHFAGSLKVTFEHFLIKLGIFGGWFFLDFKVCVIADWWEVHKHAECKVMMSYDIRNYHLLIDYMASHIEIATRCTLKIQTEYTDFYSNNK